MLKVRNFLKIKGARQHNLKNIDVNIPLQSIVVITGVSGSGKSSLALDCIYNESKYRYLDALGLSHEEAIHGLERPNISSIENLPPAISLSYEGLLIKKTKLNAAGILGVLPELRILFASCGHIICPKCGYTIKALSIDQILNEILRLQKQSKLILLAPITYEENIKCVLQKLLKEGFSRIRLNNEILLTEEALSKDISGENKLEIVIDRLILKEGIEKRLLDSLRLALLKGKGRVSILQLTPYEQTFDFCEILVCPNCNINFPTPYPEMLSPFSKIGRCPTCQGKGFNTEEKCKDCDGTGLSLFARSIRIWNLNIVELLSLNFIELKTLFDAFLEDNPSQIANSTNPILKKANLKISPKPLEVAKHIIKEISKKISYVINLGIGYIKLNHPQPNLAAGEIRKLALIATICKSLTGVLFILDEPALGLYPTEVKKLLTQLINLKKAGNSILLIEHNLDVISNADFIIDMGPGAGEDGGYIVATGSPEEIKKNKKSVTSPFLLQKNIKPIRKSYKPDKLITLDNLILSPIRTKPLSVNLPMKGITCIYGVSGSGKTLLLKAIKKNLKNQKELCEYDIVDLEQSEILKTNLSMPVTYLKIYDYIRKLYARIPEARQRGLKASHFSLNKKGGRCERCKGLGYILVELKHLPAIKLRCDVCLGKRFSKEVLSIKYRGLSIAECLELSVSEAIEIFSRIPSIRDPLIILKQVGLGYLKLGQSSTSLSSGEAQRLRFAKELLNKKSSIYLLDEPFMGLHPIDQEKIISVLDRLIQAGNTIIMAENNLRAIINSDWVIKMGPGAESLGGNILYEGSVKDTNLSEFFSI